MQYVNALVLFVALLLAQQCLGQQAVGVPANLPARPAALLTVQAAVASGTSQRQPIPDLRVMVVGTGSTGDQQATAVTDSTGKTTTSLPPGQYRLFTPRAVHLDGKWYTWDLDLSLAPAGAQMQLSERNAIVTETSPDGSSTTSMTVTPPTPAPSTREEGTTTSNPAPNASPAVNASNMAETPVDTAPADAVPGPAQSAPAKSPADTEASDAARPQSPGPPAPSAPADEVTTRTQTASVERKQQADNSSISIGIVVDGAAQSWNSGRIREFVRKFLTSLGPSDEYSVVAASAAASVVQPFTSNTDELSRALRHVRSTHKPVLFDAVVLAADYVSKNAANGRRALLVIVSGKDNNNRARLDDVLTATQHDSRLPIYAIAIPDADWRAREACLKMAERTGGTAYFPAKGSELLQLSDDIVRRIFTERGTGEPDGTAEAQARNKVKRERHEK